MMTLPYKRPKNGNFKQYSYLVVFQIISSGTDEVWAKREASLCNESVKGHFFWSNLRPNCIFKWTWFVKTDIWTFPVAAALIFFFSFFTHFSPFFYSVPLLFHSNFQSWQMPSLPTLDPYVFFLHFEMFLHWEVDLLKKILDFIAKSTSFQSKYQSFSRARLKIFWDSWSEIHHLASVLWEPLLQIKNWSSNLH